MERASRSTGKIKVPTASTHFGQATVPARSVFCQNNNTFIIDDAENVWAMGSCDKGVCGTGQRSGSLTEPAKLNGLANVKQLGLGANYCLALTNEGRVFSWGMNNYGQLGMSGNMISPQPSEISISNDSDPISQVACGSYFSLAVTRQGEVWSWGMGTHGQLGHGDKSDCYTPKKIAALSDITQVAAGDSHSIALNSKGEVFTFGEGKDGQIGRGSEVESSASYRTLPKPVEFFTRNNITIQQIAAAGNHCLAFGHS